MGLESQREHDHVAGQPLQRPGQQLKRDGRDAVSRAREDHEPAAGEVQHARRGVCRARDARRARASTQRQQTGSGEHERAEGQRDRDRGCDSGGVSAQQRDAAEGDRRENGQCEQVDQRLREHGASDDRQLTPGGTVQPTREDEHARGLADASRKDRRAHHADHRRANHRTPANRRLGQSRAQRLVPRGRPQQQRAGHQQQRQRNPAGFRRHEGVADAVQAQAREREDHQTGHEQRRDHDAQAPPPTGEAALCEVLRRAHRAWVYQSPAGRPWIDLSGLGVSSEVAAGNRCAGGRPHAAQKGDLMRLEDAVVTLLESWRDR